MIHVPEAPARPKRPNVTPVQQRLLEELAEVRRVVRAFTRHANRHRSVRFESPENTYLRAVQWMLERVDAMYPLARDGEGRLELSSCTGPDGHIHPMLLLRPAPAKVVDLAAYRERRRQQSA